MKKYLSKPQKTMPSSKTTSFHQEELENMKLPINHFQVTHISF